MGSDSKSRAAYVEDCDEDDKSVRGTMRSSSTTQKKDKGERHGRSSKDKPSRRDSGYSSQAVTTGSEKSSSPKSKKVEEVRTSEREERRKSSSGTSQKSPRKSSSRPPLSRSNVTSPAQLEMPHRPRVDPSYYGQAPEVTTVPNSTSNRRRQSYYEGMSIPLATAPMMVSRPPVAPSAYYQPPSPVMSMPTSYPVTSPGGSYMRYAPAQPDLYFESDPPRVSHLADRFTRADPIFRTKSVQGVQALTAGFESHVASKAEERENNIRRRMKEADDTRRMPPPVAPLTRPSVHRVATLDRDVTGAYSLASYDEEEDQRLARQERRDALERRVPRRPSANRSSTYEYGRDSGDYRIETASRRRSSYYDSQPSRSSAYEDKAREATGYQEEVSGGRPALLTAEALRKQQGKTGSSRSTRSSGSRDESDFKRSATTRTTTSRADEDGQDITIRLKGGATVNIGGAEIKCGDGAEVNIVRSKSIRNGSERSASEYGTVPADTRSSRDRRPALLSRSTSKSGYSAPAPAITRYGQNWF